MRKIVPKLFTETDKASAASHDTSIDGFIARLRKIDALMVLEADGVWEFYVDDFADNAKPNDRPLTRGQFFRKLSIAGIHRFRSGAKNMSGRRPYLYRLVKTSA